MTGLFGKPGEASLPPLTPPNGLNDKPIPATGTAKRLQKGLTTGLAASILTRRSTVKSGSAKKVLMGE